MTAKDFADRLEARTYQDDDGLVGVYEIDASDADAVTLSRPMCASLVDELNFVTDRLNDPLARETAQVLADFAWCSPMDLVCFVSATAAVRPGFRDPQRGWRSRREVGQRRFAGT